MILISILPISINYDETLYHELAAPGTTEAYCFFELDPGSRDCITEKENNTGLHPIAKVLQLFSQVSQIIMTNHSTA